MISLQLRNVAGQAAGSLLFDPVAVTLTYPDGTRPDYSRLAGMYGHTGGATPLHAVRIVLGRGCNYRCSYCHQAPGNYADTPRRPADRAALVEALAAYAADKPGINVSFWGGEPLLYAEDMIALTDMLQERVPGVIFSLITNGSLLTDQLTEFLIARRFSVCISHDGPGQHQRGGDPLADAELFARIRRLYTELEHFSFNPVMTRHNLHHSAIVDYFRERFGSPVCLGEAAPVMPIDESSMQCAMRDEDLADYVRNFYQFLINQDQALPVQALSFMQMQSFVQALAYGTGTPATGRCAGASDFAITVDMAGNVLTCQSAYPHDLTPLGESQCRGHISQHAATWQTPTPLIWTRREACRTCPVVFFCRGGCPYMGGAFHEATCKAWFHHYLAMLGAVITQLTGHILTDLSGTFKHAG